VAETPNGSAPRFSPLIALIGVAAGWEARLAAELRTLGISTRKFALLGHISAEPGISFSELARRSHITVQSAHAAVHTLVDDGLVADATAQAGAASDLSVTAKGAAVLRDAQARLGDLDQALTYALPDVAASLGGVRAGVLE
jgi:DNA-binding MarR family transcriptional regulator